MFAKGGNAFYDVFTQDDLAYIALDGGLGVLDVKDHSVWVKGNHAYVADNKEKKLTVVNIEE